jgi:hypothetical protein
MRNTTAEKRAPREDVDSGSLFANFLVIRSHPAAGLNRVSLAIDQVNSPILRRTDKISSDGGEPGTAGKRQGQIELLTQQLENGLDPGFTPHR